MLSKERLSAIRAKVNRADSSQNKKSVTLSSVSTNGDRITERKKESFKTANSFIIRGKIEENETLTKRGERSLNCAQQRYIVVVNGKAHTVFTHRCRSRHCQNCQRIKAFVWQEKMKEIFPDLISKYPNHKYLFITFTVKNPKLKNLKSVLICMSRAYAKMFQRKAFKKWFVGDIRSTEITRGNSGEDEAHPHFHALICVHPSYFQGVNYMSADVWGKNWGECLEAEFKKEGLEYNAADYPKGFPRVDIRLAKSADRKTDITNKNITEHGEQLINYVLKYSVKGSDLLKNGKADAWFWEFDKQVKNIRMIAASGDIKKSLAKLERDQFDYYNEQEKIEKLIADDVNFKADKAVFKKEDDYNYYLESKKDKFQYIIEAIEAKAYNYQCYYKALLSDHLLAFRSGIDGIIENFRKINKTKTREDFEILEAAEQELVKIQCERIERLRFICDALVRVGLYKKMSDFVYMNIHTNEKTVIVKNNIVDILKAAEQKLLNDFKQSFMRLESAKTQDVFNAIVENVNEKSALIKLVRNEILAAGAYAYDADNLEYIDLETNERLEVIATIE
ncbi:protein rep [Salmonella enterica]|uniref:protein rep n=2 Tax=Enterobacteriaceae TaxID=543 RepID=UPI0021B2B4DB|nr:protein rep [Salmonella enterica]MCT6788534.1 protein rep [Salmonella enterica subsp. enterica serovar Newport]MCT6788548.1 protein rep [Salmonella enterica subsp. enterica serovar Newport]